MAPNNNNLAAAPAENTGFPFMKWKWHFISISIVLGILSVTFMIERGLNLGVDFRGGIKLVYKFKEPTGDGRIRGLIEGLNVGDVQVVRFGVETENSFLIKIKQQEGREIVKEIMARLNQTLGPDGFTLLSEEMVGAKVGADLRKRGFFAMGLTWLLMLVYIGWRFDFLFSPGAIVALLHDVIISLGFFVFFGKEFNLPILAAVLTLIGYSVNDTVIIFDRIRENLKKLPASVPLSDLVNRSVNETLSRTVITSLTVLFAMVVLFLFGGGVIHDFAFFMVVGAIVGSYSTIFIASPVYLAFNRLFPHRGLVRGIGKR
ncbi:MAG: protein translocase subunit SecF [Deltaproteobacteria bacterium]|nr:protein translocase subunit SecF [Deltaproteobacteria bacterium]